MIKIISEMSIARSYKERGVQIKTDLLLEYVDWCLRTIGREYDVPGVFAFDDEHGNKKYFILNQYMEYFIKDTDIFNKIVVKIKRLNELVKKINIRLLDDRYDIVDGSVIDNKDRIIEEYTDRYRLMVNDVNNCITNINNVIEYLYNDIVNFDLEHSDVKIRSTFDIGGSKVGNLDFYNIPTKYVYECDISNNSIVSTDTLIQLEKENPQMYSFQYPGIITDISGFFSSKLDKNRYVSIEKVYNSRFRLKLSEYTKEILKNVSLY